MQNYKQKVIRWLALSCLSLFFTLPNIGFAADIDCTSGAQSGTFSTNGGSLIGGCIFTAPLNGSPYLGILNYQNSSLYPAVTHDANPVPVNPFDLGTRVNDFIKDMGMAKPSFASCSTASYSAFSKTAVNAHWYCAKFVGANHTGYVYGQFLNGTGFVNPKKVNCNLGAELGQHGPFANSLIGSCHFAGNAYVGFNPNPSTTTVARSIQSSANPVPVSSTSLGSAILAESSIKYMGLSQPSFDLCANTEYAVNATEAPAVDGGWYCAEFRGTEGTGYLFTQLDTPTTGFNLLSLSLDIDGNGQLDALTDGLLILRYLFNFTGTSLVDGAIGANATRMTGADIQSYLDQLITTQ